MTAKIGNLKNPVRSSWIRDLGCRLDAPPFVSGALEARKTLEALRVKKDQLASLTRGGLEGIYHAGREGRRWVDGPQYGIPFLGSSDILNADLSHLPFMSRKQTARNPRFILREGWTLITRSGTIGRTAYCRKEMDGMACSEHVMRVVPDEKKVLPGYLYSFISSKFGIPIVVSGTYGSIIQSIEPQHIATLPVPRFGHALEGQIHELIDRSSRLRSWAATELADCAACFDKVIFDIDQRQLSPRISEVSVTKIQRRMDAQFHDRVTEEIRKRVGDADHATVASLCSKIFLPGIFKRIHIDDETFGAPYLTGSSLYRTEPDAKGILSRKTSLFNEVLMHYGTILVQAFGQEGGLTGRPVWVGRFLDQKTTTHMLARLQPTSTDVSGLLFAFLWSQVGYQQVRVLPFGGSIPHFNEEGIGSVLMPLLPEQVSQDINRRVLKALNAMDDALDFEREGRTLVEKAIEENA